jgi:hypothetical protein
MLNSAEPCKNCDILIVIGICEVQVSTPEMIFSLIRLKLGMQHASWHWIKVLLLKKFTNLKSGATIKFK